MADGFYVDARYEEQMSLLTDAQAGVLMKALLLYVNEKPIPEMDGMTAIIFTCMRHEIDYEKQKKQMLSLVRKEAGKKGGRPPKSLINKGNKAKKPNAFFGFCKDFPLIGKESTKEKDYNPIQRVSKKEKYIKNNHTVGAYTCESHEEVMRDYGMTESVIATMQDFLRHCFLNGHVVTNAKLEDILFRLVDRYGQDARGMNECINKAISGGYLDIRA